MLSSQSTARSTSTGSMRPLARETGTSSHLPKHSMELMAASLKATSSQKTSSTTTRRSSSASSTTPRKTGPCNRLALSSRHSQKLCKMYLAKNQIKVTSGSSLGMKLSRLCGGRSQKRSEIPTKLASFIAKSCNKF